MSESGAIIIPARYGSTRFPGKPLKDLEGRTLLQRTVDAARAADPERIIVATDHAEILAHAREHCGVEAVMTPESCATGTDRVYEAWKMMESRPDIVLNLQGDNPFVPPHVLRAVLDRLQGDRSVLVATPAQRLTHDEYKSFSAMKSEGPSPFSGTTVTVDRDGRAFWFSKNIIPAVRGASGDTAPDAAPSPVRRHIGLYGYRAAALEQFFSLPRGFYEECEKLEQLRFLENGIPVHVVDVERVGGVYSGIDTPEDLERARQWLREQA